MALRQTCQSLVEENLETYEKKKSEDCSKNSEILFFPRSNTFSIKGTRHQPNSQGLLPRAYFPFQNGGQTRRKLTPVMSY